MKIKDLLTKVLLCIIPLALFFVGNRLNKNMGEGEAAFSLGFIYILNVSVTCTYVFMQRNKLLHGDEKSIFLSKRVDLLLIISQVCLMVILYLFYIKFWGAITLSEVYIFIAVMLYGNYYTLSPMPSENVSVFFEDEDVWRKVCKLKGRLIFGFGLIGLLAVFYFSPNGLGIEYMALLLATIVVTFSVTYLYAKNQYFKKYNR